MDAPHVDLFALFLEEQDQLDDSPADEKVQVSEG